MGMYTEIYVNVDLKEDTPSEIIEVLERMIDNELSGGEFPQRWAMLFRSGSYYTPNTECGKLTFDHISQQYSLLGKGDIKNYENEIESFFEWIKPYVKGEEGDFIGYLRYEEDQNPTLMFI